MALNSTYDYKTRHLQAVYSGKPVRVKQVGAPFNPYEEYKRKTPVSSVEAVPVPSVTTNRISADTTDERRLLSTPLPEKFSGIETESVS